MLDASLGQAERLTAADAAVRFYRRFDVLAWLDYDEFLVLADGVTPRQLVEERCDGISCSLCRRYTSSSRRYYDAREDDRDSLRDAMLADAWHYRNQPPVKSVHNLTQVAHFNQHVAPNAVKLCSRSSFVAHLRVRNRQCRNTDAHQRGLVYCDL
jgi:hypothetical protein